MTNSGKTVVTGGAGFIGSHLVERLLGADYQVVVVDNCSTGRWENLAYVKDRSSLSLVEADICDYEAIRPVFEEADHVYHLAALADIVPSIRNPVSYYRTNVDGTLNVLEAARDAKVKRFMYTASSSCYGIPDQYPTPETTDPRPQYPYALTKWLGEQTALHWCRVYGMPVVSLRLFNVFGPKSRTAGTYGAVFGVFLAQKLAGMPLTIVGDGEQSRDFTYVTDVADAMFTAVHADISGRVYNVGSGNHYRVNYLAELIGGETVHIPKRPGEPDCTFADTTRIAADMHWQPKVSFELGVQNVLDNIDYWRKAPVWNPDTIAEATQEWFKYLK